MIAQSFASSAKVFLPFSNVFAYSGILAAAALLMAYFIMITSWVGYYTSIKKNGYTHTRLGATRFGLDFLILFTYYYMIVLLVTDFEPTDGLLPWMKAGYHDAFIFLMPFLFGVYIAWDGVKYLEYRCESKRKKDYRLNRFIITAIFLAAFLVQSAIYAFAVPLYDLKYGDIVIWDFIFVISSTILILCYRSRKVLPQKGRLR